MSADEIDAELLAMAGDSSDDEEAEEVEASQETKQRSPSQEAKPSVEKVEEAPARTKGIARKVKKRGRKRREIQDELDDLADGSPSPSASIHSAGLSSSEQDADAPGSPDADDGPLYPIEGKFTSSRDRDDILALPEIQREEILAERAQEVLKRQQDLQLKKALAATQAAAGRNKRKALAAGLEEDVRKTSRPKTEKTGKTALDAYKQAREQKGADRTSRIDAKRDKKDDRAATPASDRDADAESEVEWAEPLTESRKDRDEPPAELRDYDRCRVGRSSFAQVCFYPDFEPTMKGCFCRVSIGINRETGQNLYRMTQIKGFTEGKPYSLEGAHGRQFQTDQYVIVAHGKAEKPWPFSACSDGRLTDSELARYLTTLDKDNIRAPRRGWLIQKLEDINKFLNVQWDEDALQAKLTRQRAMTEKLDPVNILESKRQAIEKRRQAAQESEDPEEVMRCDAELAAMDNNNNNLSSNTSVKVKPSPAKLSGAAHQEKFARLNQLNRGKNTQEVRKALIEEKRKLQKERERAQAESKAKAEAEAEKARLAKEKALLGVPRMDMHELFGEDSSRAGTPMSGPGTPRARRSRAGTPMMGLNKEKSGLGLGAVGRKKNMDDDVIASLDLGIDVEI